MDVLNVRAEYLRMAHFFYYFIGIISLAFAMFSLNQVWIAFFLFMVSFGNIFISWVSRKSVERFFKDDWDSVVDYVLLFFMAVSFVAGALYTGIVPFETLQTWVLVGSCFLFFWAFLNYVFTRFSVIRDIFRIVRLTKYTLGMSRLFSIFTSPGYEGLVDVLNLIEPRLVKYYEPGSSKEVDVLLSMIADERDSVKLRKLLVIFGVELYKYSIGALEREQDEKDVDNSALIRRFGYKMKLLELIGE